jgi:hypothetical protein
MQEIGFELFVTGVRVGLRITNSQKIKIEIIYIFAVLSMSQTHLARPVLPLCAILVSLCIYHHYTIPMN